MLREIVNLDWYTVFILVALVLVTMAKFLYPKRFRDFLEVIGNSKYLKIYVRDQKFVDGFDALMFLNLVISVSIFGYYLYNQLVSPEDFELSIFLKILFAIASLVLIKVLIERLIGSLFDIDNIIDSYLFQKTTYKNYTGLILLPINILLLYTFNVTITVLIVCLSVIVVIHAIGFITAFKNHQNLLLDNIFYFILYLCALEIGPYLILYELIADPTF
ncbi:MAG: DUF4271 domain-containing protein [Flavobacteriaceae bacterium]|nr:DUF4271 domain-containing protein [Flavobacteriaceae bacterium]